MPYLHRPTQEERMSLTRKQVLLRSDPEMVELISAMILIVSGVALIQFNYTPGAVTTAPVSLGLLAVFGDFLPLFGTALVLCGAFQAAAVYWRHLQQRLILAAISATWSTFIFLQSIVLTLSFSLIATSLGRVLFYALFVPFLWWVTWRLLQADGNANGQR